MDRSRGASVRNYIRETWYHSTEHYRIKCHYTAVASTSTVVLARFVVRGRFYFASTTTQIESYPFVRSTLLPPHSQVALAPSTIQCAGSATTVADAGAAAAVRLPVYIPVYIPTWIARTTTFDGLVPRSGMNHRSTVNSNFEGPGEAAS